MLTLYLVKLHTSIADSTGMFFQATVLFIYERIVSEGVEDSTEHAILEHQKS